VAEYEKALHRHDCLSKFVRASGRFELTAVGDVNTYALFAELNWSLLNNAARTGILLPTGIATDDSCKAFFSSVVERRALASLFDFENREGIFPAIDSRIKFSALTLSGKPVAEAQFAFFLTRVEHLQDKLRRFTLSADDLALLNPNTRTCPVFRTQYDALLTRKIYQHAPVLVNERTGANPWGVRFMAMFHMSNDSGSFTSEPREDYLPLYEAKLFHQFDHRWATYEDGEPRDVTLAEKQDPEFRITPRYWVPAEEVRLRASDVPLALVQAVRAESEEMARGVLLPWWAGYAASCGRKEDAEKLIQQSVNVDFWNMSVRGELRQHILNTAVSQSLQEKWPLTERYMDAILPCKSFLECARTLIELRCPKWLLAFRDIARATDERTAIFSFLPQVGVGHNAPLVFLRSAPPRLCSCFLGNFNSIAFDYIVRQKVGGTHLTFFVLNQLPLLPPDRYADCDVGYISPRVAELCYTSCDLDAFGQELGYTQPFAFDPKRRAQLRAELDAYYAHLYGLTRDELRYILDPKDLFGPDFPGETFRVLKEREEKEFGEYRTRRLVLEAFDKLAESPRFRDEMPKRVSAFEVPKTIGTSAR
jgi:hypothetical protein